ncbi:unnamed protein product [Musa hybrid cultivar]
MYLDNIQLFVKNILSKNLCASKHGEKRSDHLHIKINISSFHYQSDRLCSNSVWKTQVYSSNIWVQSNQEDAKPNVNCSSNGNPQTRSNNPPTGNRRTNLMAT